MMTELKSRMLKNCGSKILNESAGDKLKELEVKEKAQRLISNFQREVLSLAEYLEKGCVNSYDTRTEPLSKEVCDEYKKVIGFFLCSKMEILKAMIKDSFEYSEENSEDNNDQHDGDSEEQDEVSVVVTTPEQTINSPVVDKPKRSLFPY